MVDTEIVLPDIFYALLDQRGKAEEITLELLENYAEITKNTPTFFHEVLALVGPEVMQQLVYTYGGVSLTIPTASDIVSTVRKNNES
jgi:hypothetical protein